MSLSRFFDLNVLARGEKFLGATTYADCCRLYGCEGLVSTLICDLFYPESGIIKRYIQIDAALSPGNSGGPLFNAAENVIGINTWGRTDGQSLNFAVHCSEIKTFLRETNLID